MPSAGSVSFLQAAFRSLCYRPHSKIARPLRLRTEESLPPAGCGPHTQSPVRAHGGRMRYHNSPSSKYGLETELAAMEIDVRAGKVGEQSTATESRCRNFSVPQSRSFFENRVQRGAERSGGIKQTLARTTLPGEPQQQDPRNGSRASLRRSGLMPALRFCQNSGSWPKKTDNDQSHYIPAPTRSA